jgi:putative ABC transport system permease protein
VNLLQFALRNLGRHRSRTVMTLGSIAFGVAALILSAGFVADVYLQLGESLIRSGSAHIQVGVRGFFDQGARRPEAFMIKDAQALKAQIAKDPAVQDTMARIAFAGLLNNGKADTPILAEGIEPAAEARLGSSMRYVAGRALAAGDHHGIALGSALASAMNLKVGDSVILIASSGEGAMNTADLEVVGIFESFSREFDARAVRLSLAAAQDLLATQGANLVVVSLRRTEFTDQALTRIAGSLPSLLEARGWQQINDFYAKTVELYDRQFGILRLIVLLMVLLTVANSVNMAVFERMGEFGTMRALGRRASDVFKLVLIENVLLGLLGAIVGALAGVLLALMLSAVGIPMPPLPNANVGYVAKIRLVPGEIVLAALTAVAATSLACLWPAWRAGRVPVVIALRAGV